MLDACLAGDPESHVACETAVSSDLVMVFGEITTSTSLDIEQIVRNTLRRIGYTNRAWGIDADTCKVILSINRQSPDINAGVRGIAGEASHGSDDPFDRHGAGDQGMMLATPARTKAYACHRTRAYLTRQLSQVRRMALSIGCDPMASLRSRLSTGMAGRAASTQSWSVRNTPNPPTRTPLQPAFANM